VRSNRRRRRCGLVLALALALVAAHRGRALQRGLERPCSLPTIRRRDAGRRAPARAQQVRQLPRQLPRQHPRTRVRVRAPLLCRRVRALSRLFERKVCRAQFLLLGGGLAVALLRLLLEEGTARAEPLKLLVLAVVGVSTSGGEIETVCV
jgi:hypothetical protein